MTDNNFCKPDNKYVFTTEVDYAVLCEACNLWCKVYKYRGCQKRFQWNIDRGNDLTKQIAEQDRLAAYQMGISPLPPQNHNQSNQQNSNKKPTRRGR
jgi:hypothetical protein